MAGARVIASMTVEGESLSTLRCDTSWGRALLDCLYREHARDIIQLVAERRGEAIIRAQALTDTDGGFSLNGLEEGTYALWAESPEGIAFRPTVAAGSERVELNVGAGVRLSGTVTDHARNPIPGALVTTVFASHSRFFEALTDDQGRYQLGPFPPGLLVAVIAKDGLLPSAEPVAIFKPEVRRDFMLSQPGRITGRVLLRKAPVAGAEVHITNGGDQNFSVITDAAGHFSLDGLFPDFYVATVRQAELGATAQAPIGESTPSSEVTLELSPSVFIEGLVRGEDQKLLGRAEVSALWQGAEAADESEESSEAEKSSEAEVLSNDLIAYTDEAGRYRLGPMPPGTYVLEARATAHLESSEEPRVFAPGDSTHDFTLKQALLVEGVLVDPQGLPLVQESVDLHSIEDEGVWSTEMTGSDGRFSLAAPRPGQYELSATSRQVHPLRMTITVPTAPLRIVVEPALRQEVEVTDETGTPLPGVEVSAWAEQAAPRDRPLDTENTNGEGRALLHVATPGRYQITAELFSWDFIRTASRTVEVDGKSEAPVRLRFEAGRRLSGQVVDWHGQPMPKVALLFVPAPMSFFLTGETLADTSLRTDGDGRFALQQVSGEQFDACIKGDVYVPLTPVPGRPQCIRVKNDGQEVRLVLGRAGFVTGRLVHPDGSPVTHFRVNGREVRREDGEISVLIHQPGVERIELSAPGYPAVLRTAPEFPEGVHIQDLGTIVLGP